MFLTKLANAISRTGALLWCTLLRRTANLCLVAVDVEQSSITVFVEGELGSQLNYQSPLLDYVSTDDFAKNCIVLRRFGNAVGWRAGVFDKMNPIG